MTSAAVSRVNRILATAFLLASASLPAVAGTAREAGALFLHRASADKHAMLPVLPNPQDRIAFAAEIRTSGSVCTPWQTVRAAGFTAKAMHAFARLRHDPAPEVRVAVAGEVAVMGVRCSSYTQMAVAVLRDMSQDTDTPVRAAALAGMAEASQGSGDEAFRDSVFDEVLSFAGQHDPKIRRAVADAALSRINSGGPQPKAIALLQSMKADPDPALRSFAAGLFSAPTPKPRPAPR